MNCPPKSSTEWKDFVKKFDDDRHAELAWIRAGERIPEPDIARRLLGMPLERADVYPAGRREGDTVRTGITPEQGLTAKMRAIKQLGLREGDIELLHTPEDLQKLREQGYGAEADKLEHDRGIAFAHDGKVRLYTPHVEVKEGETPADAAYHYLAHEAFHLGEDWVRANAPELHERLQDMRSRVADAELDEMAKRGYDWLADWRTSPEKRAELASEWLADQLRRVEKPPREGLIADLLRWLHDVWKRFFPDKEPHLNDLRDLFGRMMRGMRRENERKFGPVRFAMSNRRDLFRDFLFRNAKFVQRNAGKDTFLPNLARLNAKMVEKAATGEIPTFREGEKARFALGREDAKRAGHRYTEPWTEKQRKQQLSGQDPDDLDEHQAFGRTTEDLHLVEHIKPFMPVARRFFGGEGGNAPAVNAANTKQIYKFAKNWLQQRTFAFTKIIRPYLDEQRALHPEKSDILSADALGVIAHAEILDYAIRLEAATGDKRIRDLMEPLANTVYIGDFANVTQAARILRARGYLLDNKENYWPLIRKMLGGREAAAEKTAGGEGRMTKLANAPESPEVIENAEKGLWNEIENAPEVEKMVDNAVTPTEEEVKRKAEVAEEKLFENVRHLLDQHTQDLGDRFIEHLDRLDALAKHLKVLEIDTKGTYAMSQAERAEWLKQFKTPEEVRAAIESEKTALKDTLREIEKDKKRSGKAKIKAEDRKRAIKHLTGDQKIQKLLDAIDRAKQTKTAKTEDPWFKIYRQQIEKQESFEEFESKARKQGAASTVLIQRLFNEARDARQVRDDAAAAKAAARDAKKKGKAGEEESAATQWAKSEIDRLDKEKTEWLKPDHDKPLIKRLMDEAVGSELTEPSRPGHLDRQAFIDRYSEAFRDAGVEDQTAHTLATRAYERNREIASNKELQNRERIDARGSIRELIANILNTPKSLQESAEFRKEQIMDFLKSNGMLETDAQRAADWMDKRIEKHLADAKEKAIEKAAKQLAMKDTTIDALRKAVRAGVLDPNEKVNSVIKALAAEGGFKELSDHDYRELAKLDGKLKEWDNNPTMRAFYFNRMGEIVEKSMMPLSNMTVLYRSFVHSVLSGLSTIGLHFSQPNFAAVIRLGTELVDIATYARQRKLGMVTDMLKQTLTNFLDSYRGGAYTSSVKVAFGKDVMSVKQLRTLDQMVTLHQTMMDALDGMKHMKGGPVAMPKHLWRFMAATTDFAHRALLTGVEAGSRAMTEFLTRQEVMKRLVRKGDMQHLTGPRGIYTMATIAEDAKAAGDKVSKRALDEIEKEQGRAPTNLERSLAANAGRDEALRYMRQATGEFIHGEKTPEARAEEAAIQDYTSKEVALETGLQRHEEGAAFDIPHYLADLAIHTATYARRKNPMLGRMITGFVSVPARLMDRSLYFSPAGLLRALAKTRELKRGDNKLYLESMGSTAAIRQRIIEGSIGTTALGILVPLVYNQQSQDDPNYTGFRITLAGPKDRNLKDAWKKQGNRPGSIEWVQNGTVRGAINYARGGPESVKSALLAIGTLDDMRLNGTLHNGTVAETSWEYLKEGLSGGLKEAAFFGLKNIAELPALTGASEKSAAGNIAYLASGIIPWSGLVRSVARLAEGPVDQSSATAAIFAQTPFLSFAGEPAINFLGDPIGEAPEDPFTAASDRLAYSGLPFYLGIAPESANARLYNLMMKQGHTPSAPLRSALARKNGLLTDATYQRYIRERGRRIKQAMNDRYAELDSLVPRDFEKAIREIDAASTRETKSVLGLK